MKEGFRVGGAYRNRRASRSRPKCISCRPGKLRLCNEVRSERNRGFRALEGV